MKRTLDRYLLSDSLGDTGLASTYRARRGDDGPEVAVKVLSKYFAQEERVVAGFFEELARVQRMQHPGIAVPVETRRENGEAWIVYPYLDWPSLQRMVGQGPLPVAWSLRVLQTVAEAIDYAHAQGVVHGDLKPTNIFVNDAGGAKVIDFGMIFLAHQAHSLLRGTFLTPSPLYAPHEQLDGAAPERSADIYSLGAIAYEMLTGARPYSDVNAATVSVRQAQERPAWPSFVNPQLPAACDWVFTRALAYAPGQRHATATAFVDELTTALGSLGTALVVAPNVTAAHAQFADPVLPPRVAVSSGQTGTGLIYCATCGRANDASRERCLECWTRLVHTGTTSGEEAQERGVQRSRARSRKKVFRRTLLAVVAAGVMFSLAVYIMTVTVGLPLPNPKVASVINHVYGADAWSVEGRDLTHTAAMTSGPDIAGTLAWKYTTGAPIVSSPVVANGAVYVTTQDERIIALDASDGSVRWERDMPGPVDASPAVTKDVVYFGLRNGKLLALNAETGAERWTFQTGNPIAAAPVVADGRVFLAGGDSILWVVDAFTGTLLWKFETGNQVMPPAVVSGNRVVTLGSRGEIYVLDVADGRRLLSFFTPDVMSRSPSIDGKMLIAPTSNGRAWGIDITKRDYPFERGFRFWRGQAFAWGFQKLPPVQKGFEWNIAFAGRQRLVGGGDGEAGTLIWLSDVAVSSPALADGMAYMGTTEGKVYEVKSANGDIAWTTDIGSPAGRSSPIIIGDQLYVGTTDATVVVLDRKTGAVLRTVPVGGAVTGQMVIAGDTLFHASNDGTVYAVR